MARKSLERNYRGISRMGNKMAAMSPSAHTFVNLLAGAGVGVPVGAIGSLLKRKLDQDALAIQSPVQRTEIPVLRFDKPTNKKKVKKDKPKKVEKKAFNPTVGHTLGAGVGAATTYKLLNKLFQRRDEKMLERDLAGREALLNKLLIDEQSAARGLGKRSSDDSSNVLVSIEKIGADLYDELEKVGFKDMPIRELLARAKHMLMLDAPGAQLAAPSFALGVLGGGAYTRAADPNTAKAKAVQNSLKERLTGKDQLIAPMPIRVESERPALKALRPGVSSLADPSKGRDVLMGI